MISVLNYFIASSVVWSDLNRVTSTTLSRMWAPRTMAIVAGRETMSGSVSMAVSAR